MKAAGIVLMTPFSLRSASTRRLRVRWEVEQDEGVTMPFEYPVISADSHITEPPDCYTAHIDPAFRDQAPHMVTDDKRGDLFIVPGMKNPIAIGLVAAAGKSADELTESGVLFADIHRSGWDPTARVADQVRDGVSAEIIYPTIG